MFFTSIFHSCIMFMFLWPLWPFKLGQSQLTVNLTSTVTPQGMLGSFLNHTGMYFTFISQTSLMFTYIWPLWSFKLGQRQQGCLVSAITLYGMLGSFQNYRDVLHINISNKFSVNLCVTLWPFKLGQCQLLCYQNCSIWNGWIPLKLKVIFCISVSHSPLMVTFDRFKFW